MIRFSLFGIPVEIQPFFWVTTAVLGGAIRASSPESILAVLLFIAAAFVSILIHELGHACVGRKLGGGRPLIQLTAFGGLAMNEGARFNRTQRFRMIAAGPGAGFLLFLAVITLLCLRFNDAAVMDYTARILFNTPPVFSSTDLVAFLRDHHVVHLLIRHLLWINFWWSLINLIPVMPLDGGLIADLYVSPQRRVFLIGAIAAGGMAVTGYLWFDSGYMALLFGFLAWRNYQNMRELSWQ